MGRVLEFLRRLSFRNARLSEGTRGTAEELRAAFRERYQGFRLLLAANTKALEIMTDMEIALQGTWAFGMSFVRSRSTAVSVNVYRMIKQLNELAPGKYTELFQRFQLIKGKINEALAEPKHSGDGSLTIRLDAVDSGMVDLVGGKMANLGVLTHQPGLNVPTGFVVTAAAYESFLRHNDLRGEIRRQMQTAGTEHIENLQKLSTNLQQTVMNWPLPSDVDSAISEAYHCLEAELGPQVKVSVRSSAVGEDIAGRAFAGQFRSELNVSSENIVQAYKQIVASKYGLTAMSYRLNRGIPDESIVMCVGIMAMVDSTAGGVIYSNNPVNPRTNNVIIHSVWGLPKGVVDGNAPTDIFVVNKRAPLEILNKEIKTKRQKYVCFEVEGISRVELADNKAGVQSISDELVIRLAEIAVTLEETFGAPQDIEWCVALDGTIYVLQSRPLQLWGSALGIRGAPTEDVEASRMIAAGDTLGSPGVGAGPVFIVRTDYQKLKFPEGAVLVTNYASPRWAPLLNRAAAVVAEVGSMAGHLANVAREFHVPSLFGVPGATDIFSEGDVITVDADGMRIYRGRVESLLDVKPVRRNLMEGSPVMRTLERVASYTVPLNLIDPDSRTFRQQKCRTLHDITRFVHEVSVREMFNFGKSHSFSERSSKRLVCDVPMQWWVLNLDDGYKETVEGDFVNLENITSLPMLALWRGVTAIPWQGPPRVDARGLMSVFLESTTNPMLDPAVSTSFTDRNYFMISRSFCYLMSRFGFHFSTVEALVGDRSAENYLGFNLTGGAADLPRRLKRAQMLADILQDYDFRVNVREDSVSARIGRHDIEYMKSRLVIIGYLLMHSRQIDMVMGSDASVSGYKAKFVEEIESLTNIH